MMMVRVAAELQVENAQQEESPFFLEPSSGLRCTTGVTQGSLPQGAPFAFVSSSAAPENCLVMD